MPHMQDPYFNRSVIYMCELNKKGAMGLIINKPFKEDLKDWPIKFNEIKKI